MRRGLTVSKLINSIERPMFVGDAITFDDCGLSVGRFGPYNLSSVCQPIYEFDGSGCVKMIAYEGLLRVHYDGENIRPDVFFNQVAPQDKLFIESMCMALHIRNYVHGGLYPKKLFLNVNVANYASLEEMEREILYAIDRLSANGLTTDRIVFEIVETAVMSHEILDRICGIFRENDIRFALDDFGKEASNIERYAKTRPDIVKLDRDIFHSVAETKQTVKLLTSLIRTFKDHGVDVLLEGMESYEDVSTAFEVGANLVQGYHLAVPASPKTNFPKVLHFKSGEEDLLKMVAQ